MNLIIAIRLCYSNDSLIAEKQTYINEDVFLSKNPDADAYLGLLYRFSNDIYIAGGPGISITRYFENNSGTTYYKFLPNGDIENIFPYTLNDETENPLSFVHLGIGKNVSKYSFILPISTSLQPAK
ncbi:MAG: hypothetical protein ACNS62_25040 [Candidatus Cyclobacteriaceae bacterium M3_2C_046]